MLSLMLFSLSTFAIQPDGAPFIGQEPGRVFRFHKEQQYRARTSPAWQRFTGGQGRGWKARFDERTGLPLAAWGPSVDVGLIARLEDAEAASRKFLGAAPELLGADMDDLRLGRSGYDATTDTWYVQLDQVLPGTNIPVWRGAVDVVIKKGRLLFFSVNTLPDSGGVDPQPTVSRRVAMANARSWGPAGNTTHTGEDAQLMVLPQERSGALAGRLVWTVTSRTEQPRGDWVSFVDAKSGELLHTYNTVRYLSGTVSAEHDVRTVDGEMMVSPVPWMRVQGDTETVYTDEEGGWSLDGDLPPSGDLVGAFARIHNEGGPDLDLEALASSEILTSDVADQAELSAYVFQSQIRQWALEYAPDVPMIDLQLDIFVNTDDNCNAYFDGDIHLMRAGSGCANTGRIADVNYHEWGHGFHYYSMVSGSFDGSISEGIGDAVAVLNTGDPVIAPGFFNSGHAIRELDTNRVYPDDWVNEVHTDGLIFGGAVWDLVTALAEEVGEDEAYDTVSRLLAAAIKSGPTIPESFDAFILADDDNGDLSDGTPNSCAIIEAFSQHGLGPGGAGGALIVLDHTPLVTTPAMEDITLKISGQNLAPECVDVTMETAVVHYSVDDGGSWETVLMSGEMDALEVTLPPQAEGSVVKYYFTLSADGVAQSSAPRGGEINPYTLYVGELEEIYCEDFEASNGGYTHTLISGQDEEGADDWMWGTPLGMGGDPDFAYSGSRVWGNDLGGGQYNGEYQNQKHNRLTSTSIDVGTASGLVLQYRRWLNVEDGVYDQARILANGAEVWTNHGTTEALGTEHHRDDQWMLHTVPIDADGSGTLTLAWEVETDRGLTMGGWNIDDVCVYAAQIPDSGGDSDDELEAYEVPSSSGMISGPPGGCACSTPASRGHFGWLLVLLGGLITAARRKEG